MPALANPELIPQGGLLVDVNLGNTQQETYTLVTCHFGDFYWIEHTLAQVAKYSEGRINGIVVVDQSRCSAARLSALPGVTSVLTFEPNAVEIHLLGHDHPSALNWALRTYPFSTSHVLVMDSDCFPTGPGWLDAIAEHCLASYHFAFKGIITRR
jgi:hypothetical protein